MVSYQEDFEFYWSESKGNLEEYLRPCVNQIHERAIELGLEFDGYYTTNKKKAREFLIEVEDDYFVNDDRRTLYILCASLCNDEIMEMLKEALKRTPYYPVCKQAICTRINDFGKNGTVFLPKELA